MRFSRFFPLGTVFILTLTLTLSCGEASEGPLGPDTPPSEPLLTTGSDISDAIHDAAGNAHFFWLPPMVADPAAFNGPFDTGLTPVVRICDLADCAGNLIAEFTTTTGPGSETVRMVAEDEHYIVNWHTDEFPVGPGPTYRIRALVAGTELGYADVQLAASGNEAKNTTTNENIGLKDGRTLPIKFRVEEGAVFVVSATDGGTVSALGGDATIAIPPGALPQETGITVQSVAPTAGALVAVELGPDGLQFDPGNPVTVTLRYDEAALGGLSEDDLALNLFDAAAGEWIIVPGSAVDVANNTVSAPFFHFSRAGVGPAAKAVFCSGDNNPNTFETISEAVAAVMEGGTVEVCDGTHTVQSERIHKGVTIEGKLNTRPTLTTAGARYGLITSFPAGTLIVRNLHLLTDWASASGSSLSSALLIQASYDQVLAEDLDLEVLPRATGAPHGSGIVVATMHLPGAHVTIDQVTSVGGNYGVAVVAFGDEQTTEANVVIENSTLASNRGVLAFDFSPTGQLNVDIDNVTITPNTGLGVFSANNASGPGPRVNVTNSAFTGSAIWLQSGASGLVQGNTFSGCHFRACVRVAGVGPFAGQTHVVPPKVLDNQMSGGANQSQYGVWLSAPTAGPFEIKDNQIGGVVPTGDRNDSTVYSFHGAGIHVDDPEATGILSGNSISSAYHGLSVNGGTVAISGLDNVVDAVHTGVRVTDGAGLAINSSDFSDYLAPISTRDVFGPGDLTCNYWGDTNGPVGVDPGIASAVYTPYAPASVAGTSTTSCTGGASVVGSSGGTVSAQAGVVELSVPAGALASDVPVVVDPVTSFPPDQGLIPGAVFDLQPDGTDFSTPASLTLTYDEANLGGIPENTLTILTEVGGVWSELPGATVDELANTVSAQIDGFSKKGAGGKVTTVDVSPAAASIDVGDVDQLTATPRNGAGNAVNRNVQWTSLDPAIATVDNTGLVTAVAAGSVTIEASSGSATGSANVTVNAPAFALASVTSGGDLFTCGVSGDGMAYCWGGNASGQLGDGTTTDRHAPSQVAGGLVFQSVDAGREHTCGITTLGEAYCWGVGGFLALGNGGNASTSTPLPVSGGLMFSWVRAARLHSCGLTTSGAAYCWGSGSEGRLGNGGGHSSVPTPVSGGLSFESVTVGFDHSCGLTAGGTAHCWGSNDLGQLGDGTNTDRVVPASVTGGLTFTSLYAGGYTTCGLTGSGDAYCWGLNQNGNLGDGSNTSRNAPSMVAGGVPFQLLAPGVNVTCGIANTGAAYCWGSGSLGSLGTGSNATSNVPVAVSGGLTFQTLTSGASHVCGLTTSGGAYCWGWNPNGQLGDGTTTASNVPVPVSTPF